MRRGPLRERDFALLFTGMTVSYLGDGIYVVAVAWQVYDISNSAGSLALVGVAWAVGLTVFVPLGGVLSDRLDRRRVMIAADLIRVVAMLAIGGLSLGGVLEVWMLLGLVLLYGAGQGFFSPAFTALVPDILRPGQVVQAMALDQIVRHAARNFAGPALGGVVVALIGAGSAFLMEAGTFAFSACCILALRVRRPLPIDGGGDAVTQLREGLRYVRTRPWLWGTLVSFAIAAFCFFGPLQVLLPYIVRNELGGSAADYGAILAAQGVGAIAIALLLGARGLPERDITFMMLVRAGGALPFLGFALGDSTWVLAACSAFWGMSNAGAIVAWNTRMATRVPPELLGRVSSLDWFISIGLAPASFALTAPVAGWIGVEATLIVAAVVPGVATLAMLLCSGMRAAESRELAHR